LGDKGRKDRQGNERITTTREENISGRAKNQKKKKIRTKEVKKVGMPKLGKNMKEKGLKAVQKETF